MPLLPDPAALGGAAGLLFQVSAGAYGALVYTWMSGLPLEAQALRYALKVLAAAREAALAAEPAGGASNAAPWYARGEARQGAERAAWNRGDDDCGAVLAAAYKVAHEIERLMGVLRFQPDARGRYVARCAPDHLVLPALAPHFTRRFGDTPWVVIDERRGLALAREGGAGPLLIAAGEIPGPQGGPEPRDRDPQGLDPWEKLWQSYHRTIAIENRKNLSLQRRFVPLRYRGYMSEFGPGPDQPPENCN
jgi:probable DNA metabolism protein